MDGYSGYNQIFAIEQDTHKTTFRCLRALDIHEWIIVPFELKDAGATYQRSMTTILYDLIGKSIDAYIDDVAVKFLSCQCNMEELQ